MYPILKHLHEGTHYGKGALVDLIRLNLRGPHLQRIIQGIAQGCWMCAQNNPKTAYALVETGVQYKGLCSFEEWQVDFVQMPKTRGNFKFLLLFVDTFS